jgi:hypothetical protein
MTKRIIHPQVLYFFAAAAVTLLGYRQVQIYKIPQVQKSLPEYVADEKPPPPKRPGTRSIRIVGPPLKTLKFELDLKRHPLPLDWNYLEQTDKKADVTVNGFIDLDGNLVIERVFDKGHPRAGRYIQKILSTWKFMQYKTGPIKYYFNVPTKIEHMKVQIDIRGLQRNLNFADVHDQVKDGLLYYCEGLKKNNVMIIK